MNSGVSIPQMARQCVFSPCRAYRYTLWREWDAESDLICMPSDGDRWLQYLMVIGLNPSTADETKDDPTIRRCVGFAKEWGFGALCMTNLFAFRSTQPRNLLTVNDPVGLNNNEQLWRVARDAGMIIAAWGKSVPIIAQRAAFVTYLLSTLQEIKCLRKNADGSPEHPLYIPATTRPIAFSEKRKETPRELPKSSGSASGKQNSSSASV